MYSAHQPVSTALNGMQNDFGAGTINPAALDSAGLSSANIASSSALNRGVKRSRSPEPYGGDYIGGDEGDDSQLRKRGRPPKTPRTSGNYEAVSASSLHQPPGSHSMHEAQVHTPQLKHETIPQTTPVQTSPPPKSTPSKTMVKALPTVRDHTTDQLNPEGDEYIPREHDPEGEKKVDAMGHLQGGRTYRCRTFTVPGRGEKLFMLATECARVLSYRDSYLLFNKNRSLFKIIASQAEKDDLIAHDLLPYSYRSRQIAIVTARSMFRQFGSRVIVNGRRVRDDYWEAKARKQGFTEDDLAGEKRPGAAKARESAAAEAAQAAGANVSSLAHADILYTNGPPMEGMPHAPALQPGMTGLNSSFGRLPMIVPADDMRIRDFSNIPRPRQELSGGPYQDRSQPSSQSEIINQASHASEFSKILNQQRGFRAKGLEDFWNKPREIPVTTPPPSAGAQPDVSASFQSPSHVASDVGVSSAQQQGMLQHHSQQPSQMGQVSQPLGYSSQHQSSQFTASSPVRTMHPPQPPTPQQQHHPQGPQFHQRPGSNFAVPGAPQQSPYGYAPPTPQQAQYPQHQWGGPPPQPQQSPLQHQQHGRIPTPTFSPHLSQPHPGQIHSPVHPSQSPHPQQQQNPQMMQHGGANMQGMYASGGYGAQGMGMYPGQQRQSVGQQQFMQPGQNWPNVSQGGGNQQWGY